MKQHVLLVYINADDGVSQKEVKNFVMDAIQSEVGYKLRSSGYKVYREKMMVRMVTYAKIKSN